MLNGTGGQIPCPILSNSPGMWKNMGTGMLFQERRSDKIE
jgi:hypothetical protein